VAAVDAAALGPHLSDVVPLVAALAAGGAGPTRLAADRALTASLRLNEDVSIAQARRMRAARLCAATWQRMKKDVASWGQAVAACAHIVVGRCACSSYQRLSWFAWHCLQEWLAAERPGPTARNYLTETTLLRLARLNIADTDMFQ
jgi:hypothetical protein